ncbi:MAG TPA: hypothetical protein VFG69_07990 [Nannocystaceae bacterium]|nr:hypothetical protein [Nannocystaceae bacterium]
MSTACATEGGSSDEQGDSTGAADDDDTGADDDVNPEDTGPDDTGTDPDDTGNDPDGTGGDCPVDVDFPDVDETPCGPLATGFVPDTEDDYPACVADSGEWTLIADAPGAAARAEAYEGIEALLRNGAMPDADAFTEARALYATENGLESRVARRDDVHYPPIPEAEQDPKVEFDQQCTILENVANYPDRCVGPAKMQPLIDDAFAAGMTGDGDPAVHAARIDAVLQWFLFVSSYKESASCVPLPQDCDSHWAYYGGATMRAEPIGFGANIKAISEVAHNAIYDGILAVLCWRDLNPGDGDPTWEELDMAGQDMFLAAHEQLDNALWYGWARLVRSYLEQQPAVCGSEADANWAFLQIAGPVLEPEAARRDAAAAADLTGVWGGDALAPEELQAAVAAIDAIFPCPQCESCEVLPSWGY